MTWPRAARRALVAVLAGAALVGAGRVVLYRPDGAPTTTIPVTPIGAPVTYVAIGGGETLGLGARHPIAEAWPQVLFRTSLPVQSVFFSVASDGATTAQAVEDQLPLAIQLNPTVVTVWLSTADLAHRVPAPEYEANLRALLRGLRAGGVARVLVANVPPPEPNPTEPVLTRELGGRIDAYNAAVARVVAAEGAELVDLHAGGPLSTSDDGIHLSTAGHVEIARTFATVLERTPL